MIMFPFNLNLVGDLSVYLEEDPILGFSFKFECPSIPFFPNAVNGQAKAHFLDGVIRSLSRPKPYCPFHKGVPRRGRA